MVEVDSPRFLNKTYLLTTLSKIADSYSVIPIFCLGIKEGSVTVKQNGQKVKIPVVGDAGC